MKFEEQLTITLIDKGVLAIVIAVAVYYFNRSLERFKYTQQEVLERNKSELSTLLENHKSKLGRKSEHLKEVRIALADVLNKVTAANNAICWLCWIGRYTPDALQETDIIEYNKEIKRIFSELVGAQVILAAQDKDLYKQIYELIESTYKLDVKVARAAGYFKLEKEKTFDLFKNYHQESIDFNNKIEEIILNIEINTE